MVKLRPVLVVPRGSPSLKTSGRVMPPEFWRLGVCIDKDQITTCWSFRKSANIERGMLFSRVCWAMTKTKVMTLFTELKMYLWRLDFHKSLFVGIVKMKLCWSLQLVSRWRIPPNVTLAVWVSEEAAIWAKKACLPSSQPYFKISSRCSAVILSAAFLDFARISSFILR